jgi:hypothetical protein
MVRWTAKHRDATPAQFRELLSSNRKAEIQNAMRAGRSLGKLLLHGQVTLSGVDDVQLERFRRRFAVQPSLKAIMFAVATRQLTDDMLNARLDQRFPQHRLASGRVRLAMRCQLCGKRTCRCLMANQR